MNFWENGNRGSDSRGAGTTSGAMGGRYGTTNAGGDPRAYDRDINEDLARRLAGFEGKSEEQLMGELLSSVGRMKSEGSFDPAALDRLYATASQFLSQGQRERMRAIIDMLKG